jgi:uncharacterized protein YciI
MADQEKKHFIYVFDPVRPELVTNPDAWTAEEERIGEAHFAYLKQATTEGTVLLAGRSLDGIGPAVVILEATSEDEARRFMQNDPFVTGGLMRAALHPFRPSLVRG